MATQFATVEEYIASFPADVQEILREVRRTLRSALPDAEEKIRYGMPAFMLGGRYAVHFAAWKKHVGLYPIPRADDALERELEPHRSGKDSVNFPYSKPIPYDLIQRMTTFIRAHRSE